MTTPSNDPLAPLEKEIVDHVFVLRPAMAAYLGLHTYDGRVPDLSAAATGRWATTAHELLRRLEAVGVGELSRGRQHDRNVLRLSLEGSLFDLEEVRELDRNPMSFLGQPELTVYLAREYAPAAQRVEAIVRVLDAVPDLMRTARARLERTLPRPFVTLAVQIASGLPSHFGEGEGLAERDAPELRAKVHASRETASHAVRDFAEWLRTERLPGATDEFALGTEKFRRLLWVREGLTMTARELAERGRADLKRNQVRLAEIARNQGVPVERLIARLGDDHPKPAELIPLARRLTDETREFVREKDLATIPEPQVCHVRETPEWAHDLWTAAMTPPGPFEKPVDGIYWVTSVDPAWDPTRQEGWMRTLNHAMLKNTTVHEVWPGHYLQALHFRRTEQSLAQKIWFSYSFCEGWAHYCEQLAIEAGFGDGSVAAEVTQLQDALLRDGRLLASVGMHTQGMSLAQATELLRTEAHLEPIHAEREAIRGTYNPEYFCYTLGKLAILDARSKYLGPKYGSSLRAFHDALLGFGNPPIGFLDGLLAAA